MNPKARDSNYVWAGARNIKYGMKKINRPLNLFPIDLLLLSIDNCQ